MLSSARYLLTLMLSFWQPAEKREELKLRKEVSHAPRNYRSNQNERKLPKK